MYPFYSKPLEGVEPFDVHLIRCTITYFLLSRSLLSTGLVDWGGRKWKCFSFVIDGWFDMRHTISLLVVKGHILPEKTYRIWFTIIISILA